ncbi:hypothetical protein NDU88_010501 [Pleurodeles waltl]|uniref:Uncharacterized protein n=1 Tax=Pleurodeles waltl TaxID=8319 RepID=A0AAV7S1F3_PLEWA|nr:hypothetical protein NDU88_010501 [Pleurodeles waltl]
MTISCPGCSTPQETEKKERAEGLYYNNNGRSPVAAAVAWSLWSHVDERSLAGDLGAQADLPFSGEIHVAALGLAAGPTARDQAGPKYGRSVLESGRAQEEPQERWRVAPPPITTEDLTDTGSCLATFLRAR